MKAIETQYKGYRFRSRLEARWAVLLDALDIKWEYEFEGYDLGEAGWYLPDFWLPELQWHLEIKPPGPIDPEDQAKMMAFDDYPPSGSMGLLVGIGIPSKPSEEHLGNWEYILCQKLEVDCNAFVLAVTTMRSARFEHGDTPLL